MVIWFTIHPLLLALVVVIYMLNNIAVLVLYIHKPLEWIVFIIGGHPLWIRCTRHADQRIVRVRRHQSITWINSDVVIGGRAGRA